MTFESSKNLSAVGSLLIVIGTVSGFAESFSGILSLVGIIMLLIGLNGLANYYKEEGIFKNALYSIIIAIVGCVVSIGIIATTAVAALADIGIDWANMEDWVNFGTGGTVFTDLDFSTIATLLGAILVGVVILFVVMIIAMYFLRKSMDQLSSKSGVGLFGTAGILMLIGAIIPIVGYLLIWIGFILATVAFFQMNKE